MAPPSGGTLAPHSLALHPHGPLSLPASLPLPSPQGKRVVVVDDSIVRGTTSSKIVRLIKDAGAAEVHVRIACPPIIGSCYYGVDTPSKEVRR